MIGPHKVRLQFSLPLILQDEFSPVSPLDRKTSGKNLPKGLISIVFKNYMFSQLILM